MSTSVIRTSDAWWVKNADRATKIDTTAVTTGELLADRAAIDGRRRLESTPSRWTDWTSSRR